jgi:hypothetical protein
MGLDKEISEMLNLSAKSTESAEIASSKKKEIIKKIKSGESTGDPIADFTLITHGAIGVPHDSIWRYLDQVTTRPEGQLIYIVNTQEYTSGDCDGIVPDPSKARRMIRKASSYFGALKRKVKFDVTNERVVFPTERHAYKTDSDWTLQEKDISFSAYDFPSFDIRRKTQNQLEMDPYDAESFSPEDYVGIKICVGTKLVKSKFDKMVGGDLSYSKAMHVLSTLIKSEQKAKEPGYIMRLLELYEKPRS